MGVRIEIHICPLSFFCYCYSLKFLHIPTTMIIWSIIFFLRLLVGSIILVGFHRSVFSDIKLCVLEELWRSGIGLWFEREGQIEPHSHQRQHLEQKSFLPTHWVSGFQMDLGHTFVFVIFPLLLISSFATLLSEEFKDGLCAALPLFFLLQPHPLFFFHKQWLAMTDLFCASNQRGNEI